MIAAKLYTDLADWWPLLSAPADYAEEASFYQRLLLAACERMPQTLLELGSGGGNNASHLKARLAMTPVDPSAGMLEQPAAESGMRARPGRHARREARPRVRTRCSSTTRSAT
jgi:SAM-dependent methyltransferase